jgi:dihydropteroate synthase
MQRACHHIQLPCGSLEVGRRTLVMGVLNITPDSFSDGNRFYQVDQAVEHALQLEAEGADLLDMGAESTRPPHPEILPAEEELRRLIPVVERLSGRIKIPLSIDTYKSAVAEAALQRGAALVNDISGLRFERSMVEVVRKYQAGLVLMHSRGSPAQLHGLAPLKDIWRSVYRGLQSSLKKALRGGISRQQILLDPGLGFGKQPEDNLILLKKLGTMAKFHVPILMGASRKSFIGKVLNLPVEDRLAGSLACVAAAIFQGVHVVRVHDVQSTVQVARICDAILNAR